VILEAAVRFYTELLGLQISDRYPESMVPGGWSFSAATPTITAWRWWGAPRKAPDPHPDMSWEFELDFRQHPSHRVVAYGVTAILTIGNAYLIAKVWKALSRLKARPARTDLSSYEPDLIVGAETQQLVAASEINLMKSWRPSNHLFEQLHESVCLA